MSGFETWGGEDAPAASELLGELYDRTWAWLDDHGSLVLDGDPHNDPAAHIQGLWQGLPIVNNPPWIEFKTSDDIVRKVVPWAAETLKLSKKLELDYKLPHYSQISGADYCYNPPQCSYYFGKKDRPSSYVERLSITYDADNQDWVSERVTSDLLEARLEPMPDLDIDARIQALAANYFRLQAAAGNNYMTTQEYRALATIIDHLDIIYRHTLLANAPRT